jgi:hypothetical protein
MSTILVALSWLIGIANCTSAILVGPMLAWLLQGHSEWIRRAQGVGWLVLFAGQAAFWIFGFKSGFPGFQYAQPWMIPISFGNFTVWWLNRPRHPDVRTVHEPARPQGRPRSRAGAPLRMVNHA